MNEPITEISPDEFATDFDNFVHLDEVTAIAAERDAAIVERDIADATIGDIAAALGEPDINPDDIAPRVAELMVRVDDVTNLADRLAEAHALLRNIAAALGDPEQDHEDLPASVEALRIQRDHLRDAARAALGEVIRG